MTDYPLMKQLLDELDDCGGRTRQCFLVGRKAWVRPRLPRVDIRGAADHADRSLSAIRYEVGGHLENPASK